MNVNSCYFVIVVVVVIGGGRGNGVCVCVCVCVHSFGFSDVRLLPMFSGWSFPSICG